MSPNGDGPIPPPSIDPDTKKPDTKKPGTKIIGIRPCLEPVALDVDWRRRPA